jgi:hypothetical protein
MVQPVPSVKVAIFVGIPQVFISYSHADSEWAGAFAKALRRLGLCVWLDQFDIVPDEPLRVALEAGLRSSDVLVLIVERQKLQRPSLFFELGAAIGMKKKVIAIVPKDIDPAMVPVELRLRKYLQAHSPMETAKKLTESLEAA